jgi:hypothetical protein
MEDGRARKWFPPARRSPHLIPLVLFVNAGGSYLVLVRLSTQVASDTGSGLLAGCVLSAPWLLALLLAGPLNRLLSRRAPNRLIGVAEVSSLILTAAAAAAPGRAQLAVAVVLVLVRGYLETITQSAASILLRGTIPPERLNRANTIAEIGRLTGLSVGAALAGPVGALLPLRGFIVVNAATLTVSALLARALPPAPAGARDGANPEGGAEGGAKAGTRLRLDNLVLRMLFARFLLVAFWQGFHTVAVTVIPREVLGGGTGLVGVFVATSAVAIFVGSLVAWPVQRYLSRLPSATWALAPMPPLIAAVLIARTVPTLVLYGVFLVFFEVAYVYYNNRLLAVALPAEVASVVTFRATVLPAAIMVSILGVGAVSDLAGPLIAVLVVVAGTVLVTAATATVSVPSAQPAAPSHRGAPDAIADQESRRRTR